MNYREIILLLAFFQYALLEGYREGYYWHYKVRSNDTSTFDIHPFFSWQRGLFLFVLTMYCNINEIDYINIVTTLLGTMLMFSFLHNGMYYLTRNKLNSSVYQKRFFAQSSTSTAFWTKFMTPISRTILFVIGLALYLIF
jgi:hypothetical protein